MVTKWYIEFLPNFVYICFLNVICSWEITTLHEGNRGLEEKYRISISFVLEVV